MPSPFPGLDPFLEGHGTWLDIHTRCVGYMCDQLNAHLGSRYVARAGERVVVETPEDEEPQTRFPDVHVAEARGRAGRSSAALADAPVLLRVDLHHAVHRFVMIMDTKGAKVVTVIELLSPSNKSRGVTRTQYLEKQRETLDSDANLVEIDLLRGGDWTVAVPERLVSKATEFDCLVSVNRAHDREAFEVYPVILERRLPRIGVPLLRGDRDVVVDLQSIHDLCYDRGRYRQMIDYSADPEPPLSRKRRTWVRSVLRKARARRKR